MKITIAAARYGRDVIGNTTLGDRLNILVYGAGVIGTLYAARLVGAGHRVTVLARGPRLADIRHDGLEIEDVLSGTHLAATVDTIEHLGPDHRYDLCLIAVRRDQVASVMPELTANQNIPALLFMLNNPLGTAPLLEVFGKRIMLGFPGAGGTREGRVVRYAMIAQQPTMLGEPTGERTPRLQRMADTFRASGFKTRTARDIDGWLKAHAFFVTAISGAIYLAGGDTHCLSQNNAHLRLMVRGVCEGFAAVRGLRHTVTPFALRVLFMWLPPAFAIAYWRRFFASELAEHVFGRHARSAVAEMRHLANDCRMMLEMTGAEAPALRRLFEAIDSYAGSGEHQS